MVEVDEGGVGAEDVGFRGEKVEGLDDVFWRFWPGPVTRICFKDLRDGGAE